MEGAGDFFHRSIRKRFSCISNGMETSGKGFVILREAMMGGSGIYLCGRGNDEGVYNEPKFRRSDFRYSIFSRAF